MLMPGRDQDNLERALRKHNLPVEFTTSAVGLMRLAAKSPCSGIVADAMPLVFADAVQLVRELRTAKPSIALVVFARHFELQKRLELFDAGADDCFSERSSTLEIAARTALLVALRKQSSGSSVSMLLAGDMEMDLIRRQVSRAGQQLNLRPKEFLLLEYLMRNAQRPLTRDMILGQVWPSSFAGHLNVVDAYLSSLRYKVDHGFSEKAIRTLRGVGYIFDPPPPATPT